MEKGKIKQKIVLGNLIVIVIFICSVVIYIDRSYYPMGGEVTIIAKQEDDDKYYITVEQGEPDDAGWGQFVLECTQEEYQSVIMPSKNEVAKSKWQNPDTLPLCHFATSTLNLPPHVRPA